jgi:hypothetical protein
LCVDVKLVSHITVKTKIEGVWKRGTKKNMLT